MNGNSCLRETKTNDNDDDWMRIHSMRPWGNDKPNWKKQSGKGIVCKTIKNQQMGKKECWEK